MRTKKVSRRLRKAARKRVQKAVTASQKWPAKKAKANANTKPAKAKKRPPRLRENESRSGTSRQDEGPGIAAALTTAHVVRTRGGGTAGGAAPIGVVKVMADVYGDGYPFFRVRADLAAAYNSVRQRIVNAGGIVTSSGGLRAVTEPATPGLNVSSAMQTGRTPYLVVRDGGTDERPLWKLYCEVGPDGSGETLEWEALSRQSFVVPNG